MEERQVLQPVAYVAGVSVKPKKAGLLLRLGRGRDEPSVEIDPIGSLEPHVLVGQSPVGGRAYHEGVGEEDGALVHA